MTHHILFNPLAANKTGKEKAQAVQRLLPETDMFLYEDLTKIEDLYAYLQTIPAEDRLILAGGDGTINQFVNRIAGRKLPCPVYYFPAGSGNDFYNDIKEKEQSELLLLDPYIENLPTVTVNGKTSYFLNGIGYGIDGYCCEEGDRQRAKSDKPVNYTKIAILGLLFHYKPTNAKITIDGKVYTYKKVWLAPTMNGRFFGGGMMITPQQDRSSEDGMLSVAVGGGCGKLRILTVFPKIFKGTHVKHTKIFNIMKGHDVTVEFDRPTPLQIDGETVLGVTSCHSVSRAKMRETV